MENRRGFDDMMGNIELNLQNYDDVALAFMDLNGLKYTNDRYGHGAGDELIVGAAQCINRAFSKHGSCYRIGGDEFAVILPNPSGQPEEWYQRLGDAVHEYNLKGKYRLSIAWGFSYLRNDDGNCKRISDWKYEADQKMYRNKQQQKADLIGRGEEIE